MLNHFRTLLLNESYNGPFEHIPKGFVQKKLPHEVQQVYNILFPPGVTRHYKHFLVQNYLHIVNAVGRTPDILSFDSRISYDLKLEDFFKIERVSAVITSDPTFILDVTNGFETPAFNDYYYDRFLISQVGSDPIVTVYSYVKRAYLNGTLTSSTLSPDFYIELTRDTSNSLGNYYNEVTIGQTGAKFRIIEPASGDMNYTSGLTWDFIIEAPYDFDYNGIMSRIEQINPFHTLKKYTSDKAIAIEEEIWEFDKNNLTRLAAVVIALGKIINNIK